MNLRVRGGSIRRFAIGLILIFIFSIFLGRPVAASANELCSALNLPLVADNNLTVTMRSITVEEKIGSKVLSITYNQLNATVDKKIDEGSFKVFFTDGSSEPQYGGFGTFFPGDTRDRTHSFEFLKAKEILAIEYNAGFFSKSFDSKKLNWVLPGNPCNLTPTIAETDWTGKQRYTSVLDFRLCVSGAEIMGVKPNCGLDPSLSSGKKPAVAKKITITCIKGKLTKNVTTVNPKCPKGYKKK